MQKRPVNMIMRREHMPKRPVYMQKRPVHMQKRPIHMQKRPIHMQKRPIHVQKRPIHMQKTPINIQQRPKHTQKRPVNMPKTKQTRNSSSIFFLTLQIFLFQSIIIIFRILPHILRHAPSLSSCPSETHCNTLQHTAKHYTRSCHHVTQKKYKLH